MADDLARLPLTHDSAFVVLLDPGRSQTCYTDSTGTSRTAYANEDALLAFAERVISKLGGRRKGGTVADPACPALVGGQAASAA
jgi:hypothetical protein